jgi:hypothetical protein
VGPHLSVSGESKRFNEIVMCAYHVEKKCGNSPVCARLLIRPHEPSDPLCHEANLQLPVSPQPIPPLVIAPPVDADTYAGHPLLTSVDREEWPG